MRKCLGTRLDIKSLPNQGVELAHQTGLRNRWRGSGQGSRRDDQANITPGKDSCWIVTQRRSYPAGLGIRVSSILTLDRTDKSAPEDQDQDDETHEDTAA